MSKAQTKDGIWEYIKTGLILLTIAACVALILSYVNAITKDIIAETKNKSVQNAMREVLPEADNFISYTDEDCTNGVVKAYAGIKDGQLAGYCFNCVGNGYGGEIEMVVGVSSDMSVSGINIVSMSETAGLGARSTEPEFQAQFKGASFPIEYGEKSGRNALTGATVTSTAVRNIIDNALLCAMELRTKPLPEEQKVEQPAAGQTDAQAAEQNAAADGGQINNTTGVEING